jgi:Cu(I)/Ag(I) efflux system membrane fusion protein
MKSKDILSNTYLKAGLLVLAGLLLGWLIFHQSETPVKTNEEAVSEHSETAHQIWTCAMHPQIRMDEPGDCPICGMELITVKNSSVELDDEAIEMSESAMKLAEVQTSVVTRGSVAKEVLLYGKIQVDERLKQSQTAHVPGRIEQLMINVTGEHVKKGQLIAVIYSPELITAQKELLEALSLKDKYPALMDAAREKLRNWKLSDSQISDMEKSGKVTSAFNLYANTSGIVVDRKVNEGDYISTGAVLFDVTDLNKVWGVFDAYESDLAWVSLDQPVEFTAQAIPGKTFSGKVSFIDPVIDPSTRIARVRIELNNPDRQLKPGMFINGLIQSSFQGNGDELVIPQTAILWTGTRSVVYVKITNMERPSFKMREITLGAAMKNTFVVMEGLTEGEEIVTNGTFSVDAAAQLAGKTSMMNPKGEKVSSGSMAGMDMGGEKNSKDSKDVNSTTGLDIPEKNANTLPPISEQFKMEFEMLVKNYIALKDAFVESNEVQVDLAAQNLLKSISEVAKDQLKGDSQKKWMGFQKPMIENVNGIIQMKGLEMKRKHFSPISDNLYLMLQTFGNSGNIPRYYQYCPMAFDNEGAYWISNETEIRNPYFGEKMLKCGEIKDTLN